MFKLLIINPGSTSTKIAVYEDDREVFLEVIRHASEKVHQYNSIGEQYEFRKKVIEDTLLSNGYDINSFSAVISRGGLIKPLKSGTYAVNEKMMEDLKVGVQGQHASNLGGIIAKKMADEAGLDAYVVDPVVIDEMEEIARVTGIPEVKRKSLFHALNQKAVGRRVAKDLGKTYDGCNFIIAHLGGGISVGAHKKGRAIDVNNALMGDGPFSPERTGTVPSGAIVEMCFSKGLSEKEIKSKLAGNAGLVACLGTNDGREVNKMIDAGDEYAALVYEAMAYNVAKQIGSFAAVLEGNVDAVILTGGLAYDQRFIGWIKKRVAFISDILVIPGEEEMKALAEGGLRVLRKEEIAQTYV